MTAPMTLPEVARALAAIHQRIEDWWTTGDRHLSDTHLTLEQVQKQIANLLAEISTPPNAPRPVPPPPSMPPAAGRALLRAVQAGRARRYLLPTGDDPAGGIAAFDLATFGDWYLAEAAAIGRQARDRAAAEVLAAAPTAQVVVELAAVHHGDDIAPERCGQVWSRFFARLVKQGGER